MFSLFLIIKFWSERNARKFDEIDVLVFKFKLLWVGAIRGFVSLFVSWNFLDIVILDLIFFPFSLSFVHLIYNT